MDTQTLEGTVIRGQLLEEELPLHVCIVGGDASTFPSFKAAEAHIARAIWQLPSGCNHKLDSGVQVVVHCVDQGRMEEFRLACAMAGPEDFPPEVAELISRKAFQLKGDGKLCTISTCGQSGCTRKLCVEHGDGTACSHSVFFQDNDCGDPLYESTNAESATRFTHHACKVDGTRSLSLSLCLSRSLTLSLSLSISLSPSFSPSLSAGSPFRFFPLSRSLARSLALSLSLAHSLARSLSLSPSIFLCVSFYLYLCLSLSLSLPPSLPLPFFPAPSPPPPPPPSLTLCHVHASCVHCRLQSGWL
jgi:hypothetical protein